MDSLVTVYVITFRRVNLLRRALASVIAQSYPNWRGLVINDDPTDVEVDRIVAELADQRISIFKPVQNRGATANFKIAFESTSSDYVSVLEDDNWWEPDFLAEMIGALTSHGEADRAVANERIWRELAEGSWVDTERTTMSFTDTNVKYFRAEDLCGSATWCNSAMLIRAQALRALIPSTIPVDLSEYFFDRSMPGPIVRVGRVLVNYGGTISSARSKSALLWGGYQCLLIGSVFLTLRNFETRRALAIRLWKACDNPTSPRAVILAAAGALMPKSRSLILHAPMRSLARFLLWCGSHPGRVVAMLRFASQHPEQFQFLCEAPMTHDVALDLLREVSGRPTCLPPTRWNNNLRFTGDPRRTSIPDTDGTILEGAHRGPQVAGVRTIK